MTRIAPVRIVSKTKQTTFSAGPQQVVVCCALEDLVRYYHMQKNVRCLQDTHGSQCQANYSKGRLCKSTHMLYLFALLF